MSRKPTRWMVSIVATQIGGAGEIKQTWDEVTSLNEIALRIRAVLATHMDPDDEEPAQ